MLSQEGLIKKKNSGPIPSKEKISQSAETPNISGWEYTLKERLRSAMLSGKHDV